MIMDSPTRNIRFVVDMTDAKQQLTMFQNRSSDFSLSPKHVKVLGANSFPTSAGAGREQEERTEEVGIISAMSDVPHADVSSGQMTDKSIPG